MHDILILTAAATAALQGDGADTVEAAQALISAELIGKSYLSASIRSLADDYYRDRKGMVTVEGSAVIVDSAAVARCRSRLLYDASNVYIRHGDEVASITAADPSFRRAGKPDGFDWGMDVERVSRIGTDVHLKFSESRLAAVIEAGSPEVATRLTKAMQVLHRDCAR